MRNEYKTFSCIEETKYTYEDEARKEPVLRVATEGTSISAPRKTRSSDGTITCTEGTIQFVSTWRAKANNATAK